MKGWGITTITVGGGLLSGGDRQQLPEVQEGGTKFIYDYVGIHRPKILAERSLRFSGRPSRSHQAGNQEAPDAAYAEYTKSHGSASEEEAMMERARAEDAGSLCWQAGPTWTEINHGIDTLITQFGAAVVTEDSVSDQVERFPTTVLNQWTYHSRLHAAANTAVPYRTATWVQLVSFGCGLMPSRQIETREILARRRQAVHPTEN